MTDDSAKPAKESITVRAVLRLLWEADHYPHLGNEDARAAATLEREALAKAAHAVPSPDDPLEFAIWLAALCSPALPPHERDRVMEALYDQFDPEQG